MYLYYFIQSLLSLAFCFTIVLCDRDICGIQWITELSKKLYSSSVISSHYQIQNVLENSIFDHFWFNTRIWVLCVSPFYGPTLKIPCADPEGRGTGGLKNHKNIGFLSNTGPDPLKITKLPSQHSMLGHHRPASETPFNGVLLAGRWWPAVLVLFRSSSPYQKKMLDPFCKTYWIRVWILILSIAYAQGALRTLYIVVSALTYFVYARSECSGESAHLRFDSRQRAPVVSLMSFVIIGSWMWVYDFEMSISMKIWLSM